MSLKQVGIAFDQLVNTLFGGWHLLWRIIDGLFFWQDCHCYSSYMSEKNRLHCPPELR